MKNKNNLKVIIIIALWISTSFLSINNYNNFNGHVESFKVQEDPYLKAPRLSGYWSTNFIHIDGNWSLTAGSYSWCSGDGSWSNPYLIENVTIDASISPIGSGILIENSISDYFIIRNCTIYNAGSIPNAGIKLENTDNGRLINNNCSNNNRGISLSNNSDNNTITGNTANNNNINGIALTNSNHNTLSGNTANYSGGDGLYLAISDDNKVSENIFNHNFNGIYLSQCNDNNIWENTISNNDYHGINLYLSNDNLVSENTAKNNTYDGILLVDYCDNNTISGNTAKNNTQYGIYILNGCDNNNISENTANDNGDGGIVLYNGCNNNTISGNTANENKYYGITLDTGCGNNNISENTANDNGDRGIALYNCNDNTISDNTACNNITSNQGYGIFLTNCDYNNITGNTANDNDGWGIILHQSCNYNNVTGNTASNNMTSNQNYGIILYELCEYNNIMENTANSNNYYGIYFDAYCDYNTISGNIANDNNQHGIYLNHVCTHNTISGNTANDNNQHGIYLYNACYDNTISGNSVYNSTLYGIYLFNCDLNDITENILYNNTVGIYLESGCNSNSFYENLFIKNGKHAMDNGSNNIWNSTTIGNYWDNHTGPDISPQDGIVDTAYNIGGSAGSIDFLPIAEDGAPTIDIVSPSPDDVFGLRAPSFNVRVSDIALETMWYTIDEGLTNYTFTDNSTIDQSAWDVIPESTFTLMFYAKDLLGNIGSVGVDIEKETQVPTIVITTPTPSDLFGVIAPPFNVSITDEHLDTMWYTLDGGLTNYTFTDNGTIDQSAWDAMPDGTITLQFYANDTAGNIGSAGVNIEKNIGAPTIIITLPTPSDLFGVTAPSFNVRIIDAHLDIMWYTIDGGLTNYTFTDNGTIDQSAWDAMPDGTITLQFYANDTAGFVGFAGVNIEKDTQVPIIIINSPHEGDSFGNEAPFFNITIIEDNLDAVWYSFDGGVTNHTIISNTTFDQTAWAALPEGSVTVTFYARDLAGNLASEDVTITKNIPEGGNFFMVVITISIVSGVAIVVVIVVIIVKKRKPSKEI